MTKADQTLFAKRYQTALQAYVQRPDKGRSTSPAAKALGIDAITLDIGLPELARIHDSATIGLSNASPPRRSGISRDANSTGEFLAQVLKPIDQLNRLARKNAERTQTLSSKIQAQSDDIKSCRTQLRIEVEKRKAIEKTHLLHSKQYDQQINQSRRIAHQVLLSQEAERKEISRELHDEIAQILAGINVQLAALNEMSTTESEEVHQRIARTQSLVEQSVQLVHRYSRKLRPTMLDDLGLIPALRSYINALPGKERLGVQFAATPDVEKLDSNRRTVIYRVIQEALSNIVRHADARNAAVRIEKATRSIRLEVSDDGKSFNPDRILSSTTYNRLGLLNMRERVQMVGGTFSIESKKGEGTVVRAVIPFAPPS